MKKFGIFQKGELSFDTLIREILKTPTIEKAGAVASFFGIVRGETHKGEPVRGLSFETYEALVEENLAKIADEVKEKHGVLEISIHHGTGDLAVGDLIMAVIVAGPSRKTVFPALEEAVERVKREAPIWKKEHLRSGSSQWIKYEG